MMNCRRIFVPLLLAAVGAVPGLRAQSAAALTVEVNRPKAAVSPMLYGLMTEEINYSYDGGLYAESDPQPHLPFRLDGNPQLVPGGKGIRSAKIAVDNSDGPSQRHHEQRETRSRPRRTQKVRAGLLNEGYWGIRGAAEHAVHRFVLREKRLRCRAAGAGRACRGPIRTGPGERFRGGDRHGLEAVQIRAAIGRRLPRPPKTTSKLPRPSRDAVAQLVSLFPPAYHDRPNGNRSDIMEKLSAMHPPFLRFPGGNYLEGQRIENRFDWKKMIGPLVDRPTHPTTWSYHSTDGMGLLEFLEWCEDLRMQPLLAVFAGYSLGGQVCEAGSGSRTVRSGRAGRDRVRHRRAGYQVGRVAVARRPSRALRPALTWRSATRTTSTAPEPTTAGLRSSTRRSRPSIPVSRSSPPCR